MTRHTAGSVHSIRPRIFYGWWVVAAAFTVCFVGFGCAYTFSAFVVRLSKSAGASLREAVGSRRFIGLYAACLICSFGLFVPFVHLVPYAQDHGIAPSFAILLLGLIGAGSTAGRFFLGGFADRIGRRRALFAMFIGMAATLGLWAVSTGFRALAAFALAYGAVYGGWVALLPALVADWFGERNVSGLIGILFTSVAFGTLIGPSAAGYAFDVTRSYALPIVAGVCANLAAAAVMAAMSGERAGDKRTTLQPASPPS